jgi:hypothetical protein
MSMYVIDRISLQDIQQSASFAEIDQVADEPAIGTDATSHGKAQGLQESNGVCQHDADRFEKQARWVEVQ